MLGLFPMTCKLDRPARLLHRYVFPSYDHLDEPYLVWKRKGRKKTPPNKQKMEFMRNGEKIIGYTESVKVTL